MPADLDMKEIYEIFFEECSEGLDVMESGLLGLDLGAADLDVVNDIFRAAHSIKGGAATFGFLEISEFTHGVETLLDEIRSGERSVSVAIVEVLLESVDCLRNMLGQLGADAQIDTTAAAQLQTRIEAILASKPDIPAGVDNAPASTWKIEFDPGPDFFQHGNDPLPIFEELGTFGDLDVVCHTDALPGLAELDPVLCRLHWTLKLETAKSREQIEEVFAWVSDECRLDIQPESPAATAGAARAAVASPSLRGSKESGSIRVATEKVDSLLNLVGELVITQSMLKRCGEEYSPESVGDLQDGLIELERYTRELQESAMQIRMLPINVSFSRFPRLVRDLSSKMGKKVDLRFVGENTELDKNVLEKMSDPLVHLVRNSLDHGIEKPDERVAKGKPETGVLQLSASHENGSIVIRVEDDGAGLDRDKILGAARKRGLVSEDEQLTDEQVNHLIFHPGFSTASQVSDVSGRGVGMDVVRNNIKELGGRLEVVSRPGEGSVFSIWLPLTLAILDGQLASVAGDVYVFPLLSIVETVQVSGQEVNDILSAGQVYRTRDRYIPVVRLRELFGLGNGDEARGSELLVIVESEGRTLGIFVDRLLEQQQVVIKSLEENFRKVDGLAGATILGNGRVALIVDVQRLVQNQTESSPMSLSSASAAA